MEVGNMRKNDDRRPPEYQLNGFLYTFVSTLIFKGTCMNKIDYIRLSHSSANQKIWDAITEKFVALKQKNRFTAILWVIGASIAFGFIAVFSWFSFLTVMFKDIRFSQHYLRTVITTQNMTIEQTNQFLDTQLADYKNRLSYGNILMKKQKQIEATFELLYKEYEIPKANISENIQTLTQVVTEGNHKLKTISDYTTWKHTEEKEEAERKQQLQDEQAKRKISAHNREKGRMLDSFESALNEEQLDKLVKCGNDIELFTRDIEAYEMKDILSCSHTEPLQVTVNKHLAVLFDKLREHNLICKTWMSVAENHNCFISKQGKPIVSKDLSVALSNSSIIKWEVDKKITESVKSIIS